MTLVRRWLVCSFFPPLRFRTQDCRSQIALSFHWRLRLKFSSSQFFSSQFFFIRLHTSQSLNTSFSLFLPQKHLSVSLTLLNYFSDFHFLCLHTSYCVIFFYLHTSHCVIIFENIFENFFENVFENFLKIFRKFFFKFFSKFLWKLFFKFLWKFLWKFFWIFFFKFFFLKIFLWRFFYYIFFLEEKKNINLCKKVTTVIAPMVL